MREATVGFTSFCPIIWRVYATPQDNMPAYPIGSHAFSMAVMSGFSNSSIAIPDIMPQVKNCTQDITTPFALGEK